MAEAIRKDSKNDNLVYKLKLDERSALARGVQPFAKWQQTPPTVVDLTLLHSGELREIRKLGSNSTRSRHRSS